MADTNETHLHRIRFNSTGFACSCGFCMTAGYMVGAEVVDERATAHLAQFAKATPPSDLTSPH